jgi:hypothetical protein
MDVSLKPLSMLARTHAPIDACLAIRAAWVGARAGPSGSRASPMRTYAVAKRQSDIPDPETEWMSTLSINYTAAVGPRGGAVGVEHFTRRYLDAPEDPRRHSPRRVGGRIGDHSALSRPAWSCRVEVETRDGQREVENRS